MPTVAAVATEEPEEAANIAEQPMLACIRPPGSQDNHWITALYIRCAIPARNMISPSRINIGMATSINSLLWCQIKSPSMSDRRPFIKISSRDRLKIPSTAATGTADTTSANSARIIRPPTSVLPPVRCGIGDHYADPLCLVLQLLGNIPNTDGKGNRSQVIT